MTATRLQPLVALVAATACASCGTSASPTAGPADTQPAPCSAVVRPGLPVTERLMAEGCREGDGSITTFSPFLCRLRDYTAINYKDEVVAVELSLGADETRPSEPPDHI